MKSAHGETKHVELRRPIEIGRRRGEVDGGGVRGNSIACADTDGEKVK